MLLMTTVYIFAAVLFASFLQTVTGFGYALAAVPLLTLVMDPKDVVMFVIFTGMITKAVIVYRTRTEGCFSAVMTFVLASLVGALPGAYVMTMIDGEALKSFIGIVLVVATIALSANKTVPIRHKGLAKTVIGLISGFLATTTSINGPPLVLYYLNEKEKKEKFRANLARYFLLVNFGSLVISGYTGTLHIKTIALSGLICLPAVFIGFWLGNKWFYKIDAAVFRRLAMWVIMISGSMMVISGLWK